LGAFLWRFGERVSRKRFLLKRSAAAVFAILILAAGKNLGQVVVGVKQGWGREWSGWKELAGILGISETVQT
jgi:hypothetical protein